MIIREAVRADLPGLLALYTHLHNEPPLPLSAKTERLWQFILDTEALHYFVAEGEEYLVSTCTLTVIPNLTRGGRPYGLIENVVTHPDHRRRGIGTEVLKYALHVAWSQKCYKVMLLTGRQDEATLRFYESAGFVRGIKTGFIAQPPGV